MAANKCCITLNAEIIDPSALRLVCVDAVLFRDLCSDPNNVNEQLRVSDVLDAAIVEVETYLQRSLIIDLYVQPLCDCFCDCCDTYIWAEAFPVHRIIEGEPTAPSQTPVISTRHYIARGDTGGQRLKVASCCGEIKYYAGFTPCGGTLQDVNAMLYAKYPEYGNAQLTALPKPIPADIHRVIMDITRYYLALDRKDMIGVQTKEEVSANGASKRTTMLQGYVQNQLRTLAKYRKL